MSRRSRRPNRANRVRPPRPRDALQVSLVVHPRSDSQIAGSLSRDVELAKAAVLYADQVDLISGQAHLLHKLSSMQGTGLAEMTSLMTDLDDETLEGFGMDMSVFTPDVRSLLPTLVTALDVPEIRAMLPDEAQQVFASLQAPLREFQQVISQMTSDSGASELHSAISDGLLRVVELQNTGNPVAEAIDLAAGTRNDSVADLAQAWTDRVIELFQEPNRRVLLDPDAIGLVQALIDEGVVSIPPGLAERSRAAHLGSGFIGRLPAFPDAPFDELLDMRKELSEPLTRYRGAVVRMSRSLSSSPFERAIVDQADDLWVEQVAPALADLEDSFTDHGLVRELGRRVRTDAREMVIKGSGLLLGLQEIGHLSSAISAAVAATGLAAGAIGPALNAGRDNSDENRRAEMYYVYRLGQIGR